MNDVTRGDETYGEDRNPPKQDVAIVLLFISAEFIHQVARSDIKQDHHHANKKLIIIDCI